MNLVTCRLCGLFGAARGKFAQPARTNHDLHPKVREFLRILKEAFNVEGCGGMVWTSGRSRPWLNWVILTELGVDGAAGRPQAEGSGPAVRASLDGSYHQNPRRVL